MRLKSLAFASIIPVVLAVVPRAAEAQRTGIRCRDTSACIVDDDVARFARERAVRIRAEALDRARFAREEAQARAAAARADARWRARDAAGFRQRDAADRARENARRARIRAEEQRDRARDARDARRYDRPGRNRIRW